MKTINGKRHYQVKDLFEDSSKFPQDSIVFTLWHDSNGILHKHPIYKIVETAEPGEVYLYLGDDREEEPEGDGG